MRLFIRFALLIIAAIALASCSSVGIKKKKRPIQLVKQSSDRASNPYIYTWTGTEGETVTLDVWWKDDGSPKMEPLYGEITALTLAVNDERHAVPLGFFSDLWLPQIDRISLASQKKGDYDVIVPGGSGATNYDVRFLFRQSVFVQRTPTQLNERRDW